MVREWRFAPGGDTGHHVHAHDYVVVPLTSGVLRLEEAAGVREASLVAGAAYARPAGVAHNRINAHHLQFRFAGIEPQKSSHAPLCANTLSLSSARRRSFLNR